ncbi:hypothetical protein [Rhodococcus opacus]|uniref:hypothetical protein n=1 Tax=Rhodococcus opacus TaxID=37919 RepID=UPI001009FB86|nr:hypothetical protein [Rhodococcus opacus]
MQRRLGRNRRPCVAGIAGQLDGGSREHGHADYRTSDGDRGAVGDEKPEHECAHLVVGACVRE